MTLVVGCASPDIGFLVGDTLLSPHMDIKGNPIGPVNGEFHALKVQILDSRTAIGFATSNDTASTLRIISAVQRELGANSNISVPKRLFELYKDKIDNSSDEEILDSDFLVLMVAPNSKALWLVTKNGVEKRERAYIGDHAEYSELMKLRKPYTPPQVEHVQQTDGSIVTRPLVASSGEIEFAEISNAMESLVQRRRSKSVGAIAGCVLRVADAKQSRALEYLQMGEAGLSPEEGHMGFSLLASNEGARGIGIYFHAGKVGYVLVVGDVELCHVESAESIRAFIGMAKQKYGMSLAGVT